MNANKFKDDYAESVVEQAIKEAEKSLFCYLSVGEEQICSFLINQDEDLQKSGYAASINEVINHLGEAWDKKNPDGIIMKIETTFCNERYRTAEHLSTISHYPQLDADFDDFVQWASECITKFEKIASSY